MEIAQSIFGEIAARHGTEFVGVDLGILFRRLILFDRVVVRSFRLREIRPLVRAFGKTGFLGLISSGVLQLSCESLSIITGIAQNGVPTHPPCHFSFGRAELARRDQVLAHELSSLEGLPGLGNAERAKLQEAVLSGLLRPPATYGPELQAQIETDVRSNTPALRAAIEKEIQHRFHSSRAIRLSVEEPEERVFHLVTDLPEMHSLSQEQTHQLLQSSLSGLINLDIRIADMAAYSAISGFADSETPLLFGKFAGILGPQNPAPVEEQFVRIIDLLDLPDFVPGRRIDVDKLLKARETVECREFRAWLRKLGNATDAQILEMVNGVKAQLGSVLHGTFGKSIRLVATTAISMIPGAGVALGPAAGALDTFLVDRIFPVPGVVAFLSKTYPSLFESETR